VCAVGQGRSPSTRSHGTRRAHGDLLTHVPLALPFAAVSQGAVELMLKALKLPRVHAATHRRLVRPDGSDLPSKWDAMPDAERVCHVRAAQMLAERLVAEARQTLSSAAGAKSAQAGKAHAGRQQAAGKATAAKSQPGIDTLGKALAKKVAATSAKSEFLKVQPTKIEPARAEPAKAEHSKAELAKADFPKAPHAELAVVDLRETANKKEQVLTGVAQEASSKASAEEAATTIRIGDEDALVLD
jgi:hypothetical protein